MKTVQQYTDNTWHSGTSTHFTHDGWNLIEEVITKSSLFYDGWKHYMWGLDLSQTLHNAGGVGGLLTMTHSPMRNMPRPRVRPAPPPKPLTYFYTYDGNGNVSEVLSADAGDQVAHYEYDPFGKITATEGSFSAANPFTFSTRYFDDEIGTYYYGFRSYDAEVGRWLNRDPLVRMNQIWC